MFELYYAYARRMRPVGHDKKTYNLTNHIKEHKKTNKEKK